MYTAMFYLPPCWLDLSKFFIALKNFFFDNVVTCSLNGFSCPKVSAFLFLLKILSNIFFKLFKRAGLNLLNKEKSLNIFAERTLGLEELVFFFFNGCWRFDLNISVNAAFTSFSNSARIFTLCFFLIGFLDAALDATFLLRVAVDFLLIAFFAPVFLVGFAHLRRQDLSEAQV